MGHVILNLIFVASLGGTQHWKGRKKLVLSNLVPYYMLKLQLNSQRMII